MALTLPSPLRLSSPFHPLSDLPKLVVKRPKRKQADPGFSNNPLHDLGSYVSAARLSSGPASPCSGPYPRDESPLSRPAHSPTPAALESLELILTTYSDNETDSD